LAKEVRDLDALRRAAEELDVDFIDKDDKKFTYSRSYDGKEVVGALVDRRESRHSTKYALVFKSTDKSHGLVVDRDTNYNSLSARLGTDLAPLFQGYGVMASKHRMSKLGHRLMGQSTRQDGAVVLRYAVKG
jgi:hypothetical protein